MINVHAIPAFSDNYIWLIADETGNAVVVDPGDADVVCDYLQQHQFRLSGILLTHHHHDHVGGLVKLQQAFEVPAWAPDDPRIPGRFITVADGQRVEIPLPRLSLDVIGLPGHTMTHIAFVTGHAVFVGDTLFSVGCGRLFEGSPADMLHSLGRLAALPATTRVYCGHEYTEANCRFALQLEPDNQDLKDRYQEVLELRAQGLSTLPTTIGSELKTNPFMRADSTAIRAAAARHAGQALSGERSVFAEIRAWKDVA